MQGKKLNNFLNFSLIKILRILLSLFSCISLYVCFKSVRNSMINITLLFQASQHISISKWFQVERELHRQELMRERERKMAEELKGSSRAGAGGASGAGGPQPETSRHKSEHERNSFKTMQRPPPLTKRQIAVVSLIFYFLMRFTRILQMTLFEKGRK